MVPLIRRLLSYKLLLSLLLLGILPLSLLGAVKAFRGLSNHVADWLPGEFQSKRELASFVQMFGSAELLMISWPDCTLSDDRIGIFQSALVTPSDTGTVYFREVITGPEVRDLFQVGPGDMSEEEARARMRGWILSPHGEQTGILAVVSDAGAADRHAALEHVYAAAAATPGLDQETVRVAGPTIEGVAIDQASQSRLVELNLASFTVCLLLLITCLRNLRVAALILMMALFNEQLCLAVIHYTGSHLDSVLLLTANLTFVLSVSIGVHLVNYYRDTLADEPASEAPARAFAAAFKPTALATVTTALGLVSLTASEVRPLVRFGAFSTVAILMAAAITMVYVALHFCIWPLRPPPNRTRMAEGKLRDNWLDGWLDRLRVVRWPIILLAILGLGFGAGGAGRLQTAVGLRQLVSEDTKIVRDYRWMEDRLGPLVPVEIVLAMPSGSARELLEQFRRVATLHTALEGLDPDYTLVSAATFAPEPPPRRGGLRQITAAARFRTELFRNQEEYASLGYLRNVEGMTYWRLTLRAPAMRDVDYGELLSRLRTTVERTVGDAPPEVLITGGVPLVYQVQQQLLRDLIVSFLLAFGLVCLALMLVFRSVVCGLICMIPNVLPPAVVFGVLGWLDVRVEVGTVLTASAALGIAVDDSLHFITWFRRRIGAGGTVADAVAYAYRCCGAAMIQTTLVCALGLVVFAYSPFTPMQRFAWCMFALLSLALVADLIVLPAILLSGLGRPFLPKRARQVESLTEFAWRIAGPRDALINFLLNASIAWLVYRGAPRVPLAGHPSLLTIFAPMSFLLPTITSFFGYLNGIVARTSGGVRPALDGRVRWKVPAALWGLRCGLISCACCTVVLLGLAHYSSSTTLPGWAATALVGVAAAAMGFVFHALAVMRAGRLGPMVTGTTDAGVAAKGDCPGPSQLDSHLDEVVER